MTNGNEPAYPAMDTNVIEGHELLQLRYEGLTKREYFAALAMANLSERIRINDDHTHSISGAHYRPGMLYSIRGGEKRKGHNDTPTTQPG